MKLLNPGITHPDVLTLRKILAEQGYAVNPSLAKSNRYDAALAEQVFVFQSQHIDQAGEWLKPDRVVGEKTWWALQHPTGKAQVQKLTQKDDGNAIYKIPAKRAALVRAALRWHAMPTKEIPNGSNTGGNVTKILANSGQKQPWCMFFMSHIYKEAFGSYPLGKDHGHVKTFWNACKAKGWTQPVGNGYVPRPGDMGVILYSGGKGQGHIFLVTAVEKGTALGYRFNSVGGNEGNAVKLSVRKTWGNPEFVGFINLFEDAGEKYTPQGLTWAPAADDSNAGTR